MNKQETYTHCQYPKCGKELSHVPGRRKKKYCDQKCNSAHWQAKNYVPSDKKPKFKRVPIEQWNEIEAQMALVKLKTERVGEASGWKVDINKSKEQSNKLEPKENTMAFFSKYGCMTWAEVKAKK